MRDGEVRGAHEDLTITELLQQGPDQLITAGEELWETGHVDRVGVDDVHLAIPVERPAHVRDALTFLDHARNGRRARGVFGELEPVWSEMPAFYFSNAVDLFDATSAVPRPRTCGAFDYEVEMAAVICGGGRNVHARDAASLIAGFVLFCDWTARDLQAAERVMAVGQGKSKDGGTTLGPVLVTTDEVEHLASPTGFRLEATVRVNDEEISRGTFEGMNWSYEELVEHVSRSATLLPGDLVAAGTIPLGCLLEHSASASFRGWLEPGDVVAIDAGVLGSVHAPITADA